MNPVAFNIGNFEIRWYGILIVLGIFIGMFIAYYNSKKLNLDFEKIIDGFLVAFPCAIVGARAYYVFFEFDNFKNNIWSVFNLRTGGLAIHGGLIGALIGTIIYCKFKKIEMMKYLDVVAPSLILAQAIGRWGNFMNGEAHGDVVSYEFISKFPEFIQKGMYLDGHYYNPTFLYESMWNLIIFLILMIILHKKKSNENGVVIASYAVLYSVGRLFIESLRTDSLMIGNIRIAQFMSILGVIIGITYIIYVKSKKHLN
ncbi:prolipoprotein diacylglyceryl transferase [Clostridium butyricum]|uniref:Phosphatidylglycerol--prolipoprotein diacylglyceryl transferase n=1 Tax=Clostridium butyricum TaxID=1492 RepID=A0A512TSZ2_CLOBU|nr:prolipoprotein diacylglyceryl transferase [Clostridium butyricum]ETI90079.1 MAG: Prolipoprotein diacylglyceryl transferase 1 [Clostridium butyricum DORA_1]MDU1509910.1 prolipoprotein diacylglyceryl transferase [Clostridium butyricum]MDU4802736.1 prolipoprotein diacylglyceryl transferase [Clostridium butyricum]NOW22313.1 phosphatidylglycerol:prolipoprotein diacylglycerol transferase [Clostridium butyricum]RQN11855.1 prolipoprotein diacylglyceryl transferase [Clostridium butyricum]